MTTICADDLVLTGRVLQFPCPRDPIDREALLRRVRLAARSRGATAALIDSVESYALTLLAAGRAEADILAEVRNYTDALIGSVPAPPAAG